MKREQRVLAIVGDDRVVVSVLYRGKLWFESLEIRVFNGKGGGVAVFKSKYLDQVRTILVDERLLKRFKIDSSEAFSALNPRRSIEVIIVGEEGGTSLPHEKIRRFCVRGDIPEALRVARRIFSEVRDIMSKAV